VRLLRELPLRALILRLALAAWKNAHGEYPIHLDELAGEAFAESIDPFTGYAFGYRRNGFPNSVRFINATTYREEIVPAGQPVLWSAGPFKVRIVPVHGSPGKTAQFAGVAENGQEIDQRQARHVGAYVFTLP
jgi:hypothetical protein